jgi:phospholipid/cholesterol/gamma-HCH transport system substrate-binding protein
MENKSHALAAGAFVLVLLSLLVGLTLWLMRDNSVQRVYELSSQEAVSGLQPQASVRYKGVAVGKVTDIGFDPLVAGHVLVRMAVDERAPITTSTFATLGFQGVTGLAFVQLDDAGPSGAALPGGSTPPARIPLRPGLLAKLSDQGEAILAQLLVATRQFNQLLSPENQKTMLGAVGSMTQAADNFGQLSRRADAVLEAQFGPQHVNVPELVQQASAAFKTLQDVSDRVGDSADEARTSARAFRTVTERMSAPGGTLDQLTQSTAILAATGQVLNASTLPRLNRTVSEAGVSARQLGRAADSLADNPQSLIFGNPPPAPGPGEPGFSNPSGTP